jgi:cell division septation protein DedD
MAIEHFEKLSMRSDPIEGGPVALAARADQSVLHHSGAQECPDEFQQLPGLRAGRLLRQACGFLLVGGVAYLIFFALVHYDKQANQTRTIPVIPDGQKQSIVPTDKQPAAISGDQNQSMFPIDKQPAIVPAEQNQATISGHPMDDARPEERSPDNLTNTPPNAAIEPLKNSALVSPDQNTAVPANDGGYVVQVSAERSDAKAQASFKTLQSRYPHVLGRRAPLIRRVELGEKGIFYRAQIGPFDTVEQARRLCAMLKSAGAHCMVQKNS